MSTIHELGNALRARRNEMGLSQARVADLSGLSRQTVSQIETGAAPDLGLLEAQRLASVLGLILPVDASRPTRRASARMTPLARAAATASVSYKTSIASTTLKRILSVGRMPEKYIPHVSALLDDGPTSLLAAVAEQLHEGTNLSRETVWKNYCILARQVKSRRPIWE